MQHTENTRVKFPALLHLNRLGYQYVSLRDTTWDETCNIFPAIFHDAIKHINGDRQEVTQAAIAQLLQDILLELDNEDLGKAFYERLVNPSGIKLIDFDDFQRNQFHLVTELTYRNGADEFRPDITLLINGMPLVFIEVKKPNNSQGIQAEYQRMIQRFENKAFRRFANITQVMIFSNNMDYAEDSLAQLQGAFYATPVYGAVKFNYFREPKEYEPNPPLFREDDAMETFILRDNNYQAIKHSPEFLTNKDPQTPTNRLLTSLLSKERLGFFLNNGIAYVQRETGLEKQIMRYPQFFASQAIQTHFDQGHRQGIIWHTQGSGKTALAFYNVKILTHYFQRQGIMARFYFIVDRLDLLEQAAGEFEKRGLHVRKINSKQEFAKEIKSVSASENLQGQLEITVVNIQKFRDDPDVIATHDYDISLQRIYFLDEVHRSYNPKGSFLANLMESDRRAIHIGLTGTPLLGNDYNSRVLFGDYIHQYYYDASIRDGYTLRLIREEIEITYKQQLNQIYQQLQIEKGAIAKQTLFAHPRYCAPLLAYIVEDFEKSRILANDHSIGAMVVCDSAEQAKQLYQLFQERYAKLPPEKPNQVISSALILYDVSTKAERKQWIDRFKAGEIDLLFVYNMLLTGFDAPRLKKLYLGRVIKRHNLLQTLTRVNRPYGQFRYGYVVDFADIKSEFDATNKAYYDELQAEYGDELQHYSQLFKSPEEIATEIEALKDLLFSYETNNLEIFSQQITAIHNKEDLRQLQQALGNGKSLYNLLRLSGQRELFSGLEIETLTQLYRLASDRLGMVNLEEKMAKSEDLTGLLNEALEEVLFIFKKVGEEELVLADKLKSQLRRTREALGSNVDKTDPEYISLQAELDRLFKQKKLSEVGQDVMNQNIDQLKNICQQAMELNRKNRNLAMKYGNDTKFTRIHKRLKEKGGVYNTDAGGTLRDRRLHEILQLLKTEMDDQVLQSQELLNNEGYFNQLVLRAVIQRFKQDPTLTLNLQTYREISGLIVQEYLQEFSA